jgi:hypothetical protein
MAFLLPDCVSTLTTILLATFCPLPPALKRHKTPLSLFQFERENALHPNRTCTVRPFTPMWKPIIVTSTVAVVGAAAG